MDAEMEAEGFQYSEIDIGYEFDAPQFFQLGRDELPPEVHQAELWFETAGNYPPSPLIVKLSVGNEGKHEILNTLLKVREMDSSDTQMDVSNAPRNVYAFNGSSLLSGGLTGQTYGNFRHQDLSKDNNHRTFKGTDSSNSCFMKPTTSHLARKTLAQRNTTSNGFQRPLSVQSGTSDDPIHGLLHAAKRQKVAGGLICKMVDTAQQSDLLHKNSKKECFSNCNSHPTKLRLTIPKEPVLETARRAKTFRAQRSNQSDGKETSTSSFKALPLNRKIFEAPTLSFPQKSTPKLPEFQEFKLKTSVRAIQRSKAATTSLTGDTLSSSSAVKDCCVGSKKSEYQPSGLLKSYNNKAKGSIQKLNGLNHDKKKFNISTSKRNQPQNPLSELFNKLSLSSEAQLANVTWTDFSESIHVTTKDSKENVISSEHLYDGYLGASLI